MNGWNDQIAAGAVAILGLLVLILLIWVAWVTARLGKLRKAHAKLVGETGVPKLEDVLQAVHEHLGRLEQEQRELDGIQKQQDKRLTAMKGKVGVHRFNAFSDSGSDLSFSVAFINEEQDGVVITGIHGREQTFLYAKPIDKGQSAYLLSPEEKTAISLALQKG
ncbi:DUF4446 family protein [Cohnella caldifontis]|uniref:DUF4446 family protein n=1 Tax=Cohnella caldifontis TaxID=3027471 RepID=UPI0023ED0866|nr:DUF4446 family protein [Cohnella sp. YIM B05605]